MSKISSNQIKLDAITYLPDNTTEEISASDERQMFNSVADSFVNKVDGGLVVDQETGYSTNITPSDDKAFTPKKYVDDAVAGATLGYTPLDAAGSITVTGDQDWDGNDINNFGELKGNTAGAGNNTAFSAVFRYIGDKAGNILARFVDIAEGFGVTSNGFFSYTKTTNLTADRTYQEQNQSGTRALLENSLTDFADDDLLDPTVPTNDGIEYYEAVTDGVKSWERVIYASGTSAGNKTKLQAGAGGDWVNGSYVGATSGAVTGTYGGERFIGQDATDTYYYIYEAIADDTWVRSLAVPQGSGATDFTYSFNTGGALSYSVINVDGGSVAFTNPMGFIIPRTMTLSDIVITLGTSSCSGSATLSFLLKKITVGVGNTGYGSAISLGSGTTVTTVSFVSGGALGVAYYRNQVSTSLGISLSAGDIIWFETNNFTNWSVTDVKIELRCN